MEQDKNKFSVVVGDFGEDTPPLFYGSFPNLKEARNKLEWVKNNRNNFDEDNAYIYETKEILDLKNGTLRKNLWLDWLREHRYKILVFIFIFLGIFWFSVRPQIVRTNCAAKSFSTKNSYLNEGNQKQYSACLKLHGLAN